MPFKSSTSGPFHDDSCKMTEWGSRAHFANFKKAANQNIEPKKYPSDYPANINWLFTPRLAGFIYFHLWNSLQAMNLSEQGGREEQGCPWQQSVSCFYIQGQRGTNDTTWIHYCDTGVCTGKICCPAEKWRGQKKEGYTSSKVVMRVRYYKVWVKNPNIREGTVT